MINRLFSCLSTIVLGASTILAQGSLTPPAAPAPSMKTLGQIEPRIAIDSIPFHITNQGSYFITGNFLIPPAQAGISIETNNVTLDLGGFTLRGFPTSFQGILLSGNLSHVTIQNGGITGASVGIDGASSTRVHLQNVRATECRGGGILLGDEAVIENCQGNQNLAFGIKAGAESQILASQASGNVQNGFELAAYSIVRDCTANKNSASGFAGGDGSKFSFVTANENTLNGIFGGIGVNVSDATANFNKTDGIGLSAAALVTRSSAIYNSRYGVLTGTASSVVDCNASANGGGISVSDNSQVLTSKADNNGSAGIITTRGSTVRNCSTAGNPGDGISVTSECHVVGNTSNRNSHLTASAGIHAIGTDNVIEQNTVISNDFGISVDVEGNMIVKNIANNNTINFRTIGDQTIGTVVSTFDPTIPNDPQSNFTF